VLPPDVRVTAWAPVEANFSARFNCDVRVYKYFFFADGMNIEAMNKAAQYLVGSHDFRNLCKMDVVHVAHFIRRVCAASVQKCTTPAAHVEYKAPTASGDFIPGSALAQHYGDAAIPAGLNAASTLPAAPALTQPTSMDDLCEFVVCGEAFLYHQVRCMMAVLLLVGQGVEKPEVVLDLLDVTNMTAKPTYFMAPDLPLILWDGVFPGLRWRVSSSALQKAFAPLHAEWRALKLKTAIYESFWRSMLPTAALASPDHPITLPFEPLAPFISEDNPPAAHPQPLSLVAPTFPADPPIPTQNLMRAQGYYSTQFTAGRANKNIPASITEAMKTGEETLTFPYKEVVSHQPIKTRPRESSLQQRLDGLGGRRKDLKDQCNDFIEKMNMATR
jgi:tRNA U38,U39,U40 pseudouridine synthase TruA